MKRDLYNNDLEELPMNILIAIVLGIVEGITEFLPVSSTGHLILVGHLLGFTGRMSETFDVIIQLGAILAVVILYRQRFISLLPQKGWMNWSRKDVGLSGFRGCFLLGLTTLPALIVGKLAYKSIKGHLFNPTSVALAMAVGGIGILIVELRRTKPRTESLDRNKMAPGPGYRACFNAFPCGRGLHGPPRPSSADF